MVLSNTKSIADFMLPFGVVLFSFTQRRGDVRVVRVLLPVSWWARFGVVPPVSLVRCRSIRWDDRVGSPLICVTTTEESRGWLATVDEEGCFLGEDLLFLHPFDCLVIEEGPAFVMRGLNVDNVMSFAHRAPFVDHYRL